MDIKELITKNIEFLKSINDEESLGSDLSVNIDETITNIEKYMENQEVKLAILGEFSSGKSTLINALLKKDILSHSNIPTTAVNTYIRYGDRDETWVWLKGSKKKISDKKISEYVKEGSINAEVEKVEIIRNNEILKKNLVIIDTPGVNSGIDKHNVQWNNATKESNAAIFVISAQRLTSRTFIDFLNSNKENLGKFIFVINKCDTLDDEIDDNTEDSVKNTLKYVEDAIKRETGIKTNRIFAISAIQELVSQDRSEELRNNFVELENKLYLMMERDKELIIIFKILDIQKQIFNKIMDVTGDRKKLFKIKLDEIKGEEVDINKYRQDILIDIGKKLESDINKLQKQYYQYHEDVFYNCESKIKDRIYAIDSVKKLKNEGPSICRFSADEAQTSVMDYINSRATNIEKCYIDMVKVSFQEYFETLEEMYKGLNIRRNQRIKLFFKILFSSVVIGGATFLLSNSISTSIIFMAIISGIVYLISRSKNPFNFDVVSYYSRNTSVYSESFNSALLEAASDGEKASSMGAGGGVIIGAAIGGPVGAIVGGIIGGILGSLTGTSLSTLKDDYYDQTILKLRQLSERLRQQNISDISKFYGTVIDSTNVYMDKIIEQYDFLLNKIMETQLSKRSELEKINNNLIKIGEKSIEKISNLEETIKDIKLQLEN